MRVKRFYGKDSTAALKAVKLAFGEGAVILETLKRPEVEAATRIEILAAIDYDPELKVVRYNPELAEKRLSGSNSDTWKISDQPESSVNPPNDDPVVDRSVVRRAAKPEYDRLRQELSLVKGMMGRLLVGSGLNEGWSEPGFADMLAQLLARKVSAEIAHDLLTETYSKISGQLASGKTDSWVKALVKAALARQLMGRVEVLKRADMARVITLVGPTGVGKTTTLAKLAASFMVSGERVALISVDTFRLGAAEQIKEYGRRLKAPVEIVKERRELLVALNSFAGFDRILVDTMGRSASDHQGLAELFRILKVVTGDTFLVLPAALQEEDLLENLVHFRPFASRALLFTKLDETLCYGSIMNALSYARLPLSFFTDGQQVPEDLETASPERVANLLLDIV
ncbi:MAG: flagellar biosynthesis protein FlhF [Deltaproteobacteria bacterium]|nr:flagellar biosynthesis protein FlhF [Deltaproteobacteria bacterium]